MDTNERIQYSVAFKGVIDLLAAGVIKPDTNDIVMEVIDLTDEFNEALDVKTGASAGGKSKPSSSRSTRNSRDRSSNRRGSTDDENKDYTPKNPDADASDAQIKALKNLMKNEGIDFDRSSFDWDGTDVYWNDLTMGNIQQYFDELK